MRVTPLLLAEKGMPAVRGWHPQDVIAEIRKTGTTLAALSRQNGFKDRSLHSALRKRWPRANAIIASHLSVTRHQIWPEWFGPDDRPLPLPRRRPTRRAA